MHHVALPETGTDIAWRDTARALIAHRIPPERVTWSRGAQTAALFESEPPPSLPAGAPPLRVPPRFVELSRGVVWHRDPERFALLYRLLWRLRSERRLMQDVADADVARAARLDKAFHRCQHKMRAFLRFREVAALTPGRRRFAAWFEPSQLSLEPNAAFFSRRFGDMDWAIFTPDLACQFTDGTVSFGPGAAKPALPEDGAEDLWRTYFANIFNPARVKIGAMTAEMPRKYWKNLPEAPLIPGLIAGAEARVAAMARAAPTRAPTRAAKAAAGLNLPDLPGGLAACTRCALHRMATQAVAGEGPKRADLMIVGEQPGDAEDLSGRPFVGPAGQLLDRLMAEAGLDRDAIYMTNAVKHFKFRPSGKRRVHQNPNRTEIEHCRPWLAAEIAAVTPRLILALGASAAQSLTGTGRGITARRGSIEDSREGRPVLLSLHPSYILRLRTADEKADAEAALRADLDAARSYLAA